MDALSQNIASASDMFRRLEHDGPTELPDMFACLLLGKNADAWDPAWVSEHMNHLAKVREQMTACDSMETNSLVVLEELDKKHGWSGK